MKHLTLFRNKILSRILITSIIILTIFTIGSTNIVYSADDEQSVVEYFGTIFPDVDAQTLYDTMMGTGLINRIEVPDSGGLIIYLNDGVLTEDCKEALQEALSGIITQQNERNRLVNEASYSLSENTQVENVTDGQATREERKEQFRQILREQGYNFSENEIELLWQWGTDILNENYGSVIIASDSNNNVTSVSMALTEQQRSLVGISNDTDASGNLGGLIIDGLAGVVFYVLKIIPMVVGWLLLRIIGLAINGVDGMIQGVPLDQILFNRIPLLGVNFFQTVDASEPNAQIINSIREQVSIWYVAIRNLAAVILAVMVLYVGIRMAISSVAEEKAKYKRMLADWIVSLVLLFVLHYIMILIININDAIVAVLAQADTTPSGAAASIMDELWVQAMTTRLFTKQVGYMAVYFMLAIMCFVFFATYVKRMITIAFLIMIAPIITITYSLDRMGDGKSQALNTWFKNFVYNILLQPFHCIIYLALVKTAIDSISAANLSSVVIAIIMVFFMYEAEDIIKEIFHFEGKSVANTIAQAALVGSAIGMVSKAASTKKSVRGYAGNAPTQNNNQQQNTIPPQTGNNQNQQNGAGGNNGSGSGSSSRSGSGSGSASGSGSGSGSASGSGLASGSGSGSGSGSALGVVGGLAKKAGKAAIKGAAKLPLAIAFGAMGLGTGNLTTGITGFQAGSGLAGGMISNEQEKANLHNFAVDYNNLSAQYRQQGRDDNWIREHTKDLLNGDVQVQDYEKDYYNAILKEMDRYIDQGLSADDAITQVEQNVAGIQGGYIGEATIRQKFVGNIKKKFNNRFNNNNNNNP